MLRGSLEERQLSRPRWTFDELVFEEVVVGTGREDGNANRTGCPSRRTAQIGDARFATASRRNKGTRNSILVASERSLLVSFTAFDARSRLCAV
jgi:hypothetical protein